ncbi:MAG: acyl-CoA dehydrogenase [Bradymonadia bacterium]
MPETTFATLQRDLEFLLHDVFQIEQLLERPAFAQHDRATLDAMLEAAIKLAAGAFDTHAAKLDDNEPHWDGDQVHLIPEVKAALEAFVDSGLLPAAFPEEAGGLGLPYTVMQAFMAAFYAANPSTAAYPMLTVAAANLLNAFASDEQKSRFMAPMLEGRFFGTMCLSEPHAGSSLADVRCMAHPQEDGTYHIIGDKMWISGGEHELSESIVHLVLARLPDAPPGVKGISLFIVPRHHIDAEGKVGAHNGVKLIGLNHKMGYRGTVNTALVFGDDAPAVGHLVGKPHHGLKYMFHMMNEARVGVGLGASMLGYAGYRYSLQYARERTQGRHPDQRDPTTPPVALIEHADVRRMLLAQKAYAEGGMALGVYCARLIDEMATAESDEDRERADDLLQILTPIAKAWPSEYGPRANDYAIQILGGCGYTRDYPVERYYRDNRLNPIHEGTNGIQGMDLLGRKAMMHQGRALKRLMGEITASVERNHGVEGLEELCTGLSKALSQVAETTMSLAGVAMQGQVRLFLANAYTYLLMVGHTVIAWMWLEQAAVAARRLESGAGDEGFCRGKLQAAQFFYRYELPVIEQHAALLKSLDDTTLSMKPEWF